MSRISVVDKQKLSNLSEIFFVGSQLLTTILSSLYFEKEIIILMSILYAFTKYAMLDNKNDKEYKNDNYLFSVLFPLSS